jgi:hypothetical protein
MRIGDIHMIVPQDETGEWPAHWRYDVATAVASTGLTPINSEVANDKFIRDYSDYLLIDVDFYEGEIPDPNLKPYHIAATWYGNPDINSPRFRIEALLLTGAPYDIIAKDLGLRADAIEAYEKLFFNTRNADGSLRKGCYNRSRFAINETELLAEHTGSEVVWRAVGFYMGYSGLVQLWRWDHDAAGLEGRTQGLFDEMWRYSQSRMLDKILRDQVSMFDLNNMMGNYIQDQRMRFDTKQDTGDSLAGAQIAIQMLQMCAPQVTEAARTIDGSSVLEQTELIAAKLAQSAAIHGEKIQTASGAGAAAIDDMIRDAASLSKLGT